MSSCPHRIEALGNFQAGYVATWVCKENCTPPGTRGDKLRNWFGILAISRIKDEALGNSAEAGFVHLQRVVQKLIESDYKDRERKNTENSQLSDQQEKNVRQFLGVHHSPVQYARFSYLTGNNTFKPLMKAFTEELSVFFWTVCNFFAFEPIKGENLSITKLSRMELVCWKIRFAIRTIDKFAYPLSLIDLLEEWAYKNERRIAAFDKFRTYLKLGNDGDELFQKMPPPTESWKQALKGEIDVILKIIDSPPNTRMIHLPPQKKLLPRASVSGSLSDVSSPLAEETLLVNPVRLSRVDSANRPIVFNSEDDFKVYVIASTLLEMKRVGWILPPAGRDELVVLLCQIQICPNDYKSQSEFCLTNLVDIIEHLHDLNNNPAYQKCKLDQKWKLILDTVQRICSKEEEREALFTEWIETALLYTFCFTAMKLSWDFAQTERNPQAKEEADRAKIFEWMGQCTTDEKTTIFQMFVERSKSEQIDRSYDPHTALAECRFLQIRYGLPPFKLLTLWLHFIHCPIRPAPREGKWLNLSETKAFIHKIEEYCYGNKITALSDPTVKVEEHCYGSALTGEMVFSLFMGHPMHSSLADTFIRLKNNRQEILTARAPFVNNFFHQELIISGLFPALVRLLTEGIEKSSPHYPIRMKIVDRIKRATLLERGLRRALHHCPYLIEKKREAHPIDQMAGIPIAVPKQALVSGPPVFEGWVEYVKAYAQKDGKEGEEEEFTIGTWLPPSSGSIRLEYSRFYSFSSLRGKTGERDFDFSEGLFKQNTTNINTSLFTSSLEEGNRAKELFREFIDNFTPQSVTYVKSPNWPHPTTYNLEDLADALNESLTSAHLPRVNLNAYLYNAGLEPKTWDMPCKLFRFLIRLKQDLEQMYHTEEKKQLPSTHHEEILQARRGHFQPLLGKKGVTLMNRTPVGDRFDIHADEYRREIEELIENIRSKRGEEVKVIKEVLVGSHSSFSSSDLEIFLSAEFVENEGWTLKARAQIYVHTPVFFVEILHLPLSFPMGDMENAIILLLARALRRYYVLNTGLTSAKPT